MTNGKGSTPNKLSSHDSITWQKFQELIAHIESFLVSQNLSSSPIVKSPDYIPDLDTGRKREVDASIRYKVGSIENLTIIECRKRKHKQDVTWIEQLSSKKDNLGAHQFIAVSNSEPYIRHGIMGLLQ